MQKTTETGKNWKDERRNTILDVAFESFREKGYAATSMAQIAARLGGSKTTLYNYFPSKDDLFVAVVRDQCARLTERLYRAPTEKHETRDVLTEFCQRYMREIFSHEQTSFLRMVIAQAARFPEIGRSFYLECIEVGLTLASQYLERMMADGRIRKTEPREAAAFLLDLCTGVMNMRRLLNVASGPEEDDIVTHSKHVVDIFMRVYALPGETGITAATS